MLEHLIEKICRNSHCHGLFLVVEPELHGLLICDGEARDTVNVRGDQNEWNGDSDALEILLQEDEPVECGVGVRIDPSCDEAEPSAMLDDCGGDFTIF